MIIDNNLISSIMDKMSEIEVKSRDTYQVDGKRVPRVTEVLSAMLHDDSLLSWSNSLGWKRISYRTFMKEAAEKGTYTHLAIEKYLKNGYLDLNQIEIPNTNVEEVVKSTMTGFSDWWKELNTNHSIEIIYQEETLLHPYFAGTCDCLLKVDQKYWLIDFKTSNHMSYNYALQLAAYKWLLKETRNIEISRCIVLMLSKTDYNYQTYELDVESNEEHKNFIENCLQCFMALVVGFKMRLYTTDEYYKVFNIQPFKK